MSEQSIIDVVTFELVRLGQVGNVQAHAHDGVVTLTGHVADAQVRRVVGQEILRIPQVSEVRNELEIPPPVGNLEERFRALLRIEGVAGDGIRIEAAGGQVRLAGEAPSWFDRDAAERVAWRLPEVRELTNDICIPRDAPDPELAERNP